jgi:hypothetical protein
MSKGPYHRTDRISKNESDLYSDDTLFERWQRYGFLLRLSVLPGEGWLRSRNKSKSWLVFNSHNQNQAYRIFISPPQTPYDFEVGTVSIKKEVISVTNYRCNEFPFTINNLYAYSKTILVTELLCSSAKIPYTSYSGTVTINSLCFLESSSSSSNTNIDVLTLIQRPRLCPR